MDQDLVVSGCTMHCSKRSHSVLSRPFQTFQRWRSSNQGL